MLDVVNETFDIMVDAFEMSNFVMYIIQPLDIMVEESGFIIDFAINTISIEVGHVKKVCGFLIYDRGVGSK